MRLIILLFFILSAAGINILLATSPPRHSSNVNQLIPELLGPWSGSDIKLSKQVYDILETQAIIHRQYIPETMDNGTVFLSLVHYDDARIDFHAPEACLGTVKGGDLTTSTESIAINSEQGLKKFPVAVLLPKYRDSEDLVYYFYKSGSYIGSSYLLLRLAVARNKLTNHNTSGTLVRVSTPIINGNLEGAKVILVNFLEKLYPFLGKM